MQTSITQVEKKNIARTLEILSVPFEMAAIFMSTPSFIEPFTYQ